MARPSIVRPADGGEITLKNVTAETKEKMMRALQGSKTSEAPEAAAPTGDLPHLAVGLFKSPEGKWHTAVVKYNPITQEARVEQVEVHEDKATSHERFKITAGKYILI